MDILLALVIGVGFGAVLDRIGATQPVRSGQICWRCVRWA